MNSHLIFVRLLMLCCVMCDGLDTDAEHERANRLRHAWLLSMKESMLEDKDSSRVYQLKQSSTSQLLFCPVGVGFHLEIRSDGSVQGVHVPTENCQMRVFAMKPGIVGIQGLKSGLYLCMNKEGITRGLDQFSPDCLFKENLEENHYTTFSSSEYPGLYLSLSHRGQLKRGNTTGPHHISTHFLPRKVS